MLLDMPTISAVSISVTAILGIVLLFAWSRAPDCPLAGWWGLSQLVMCGGIILAASHQPLPLMFTHHIPLGVEG